MARQHNTPEERLASLETSSDTLVYKVGTLEKKIDHQTEVLHNKIENLPERLSEKLVSKSEFNGMRWLVRTIIAGLVAIAFSVVQMKAG